MILFGKSPRPFAGTTAAAVMLNSLAEVDPLTLSDEKAWTKLEHSRLADKLWDEFQLFLEGLGPRSDLRVNRGTVVINSGVPGSLEDESFHAIRKACESLGEPCLSVNLEDVEGYSPSHEGRATDSVFLPREGWLDPSIFISELDRIAAEHPRIDVVDSNVIAVDENFKGVALTDDSGKNWIVDKVIVANGWGAKNFLAQFGLIAGEHNSLYAGEGSTLRIRDSGRRQEWVIRTPNRGLACGLYAAPHDSEIVVGATNQVSENPQGLPTLEAVRTLSNMAFRELDTGLSAATLVRLNHGVRPVTTDGLPMVGWLSEHVYLITGTRRDGWHFAPLWSQLAVSDILGRDSEIVGRENYDPHRKVRWNLTIEQSVELATRNYMSGMIQHGFSTPGGSYGTHIEENYRAYFMTLHKFFELEKGLPIDLIGIASRRRSSGVWDATF